MSKEPWELLADDVYAYKDLLTKTGNGEEVEIVPTRDKYLIALSLLARMVPTKQ
jgi:hypothetical protein